MMLTDNLKKAFIDAVENSSEIEPLVRILQKELHPGVLNCYGSEVAKLPLGFNRVEGRALAEQWELTARTASEFFNLEAVAWLPVLLSQIAFALPETTLGMMDAITQGWRQGRMTKEDTTRAALAQPEVWETVLAKAELSDPAMLPASRLVPADLQKLFWRQVESIPGSNNIIETVTNYGAAYDQPLREAYATAMLQHTGLPEAYQENYLRPPLNIQDLKDYPKGTLAYAYYHQIVDNGLDVEILKVTQKVSIGGVVDYAGQRIFQTHDLWHVLTEYTTDGLDEIALQAFQLAQLGSPFSSNLLASLMTRALLFDPQSIPYFMQAICVGWTHGRKTPPLLPVKWEQAWGQPVVELRRQHQIEPFTANLMAMV